MGETCAGYREAAVARVLEGDGRSSVAARRAAFDNSVERSELGRRPGRSAIAS